MALEPTPLFAAAAQIQEVCREKEWRFCFIGGLANLRWGEPRVTRDVDLTIVAEFGAEGSVIDDLLQCFDPRIPNAREFAVTNRVLLLVASNGVPTDVALGALDFEEGAVRRASGWDIGEVELMTCSAEDLLVYKVFAGRDQDWLDVAGILTRQSGRLDEESILVELAPLLELKDSTEDLDRLRCMLKRSK